MPVIVFKHCHSATSIITFAGFLAYKNSKNLYFNSALQDIFVAICILMPYFLQVRALKYLAFVVAKIFYQTNFRCLIAYFVVIKYI